MEPRASLTPVEVAGKAATAQRRKSRVALLSVASNSSLVLLKLTVGLTIGSVSVLSEAAHSGVDLLASIIALFAVRTAGKPADEDHPFGHGKVENVSGTVEAVLIFLAAGWIIYEAVGKLLDPHPIEQVGWGVAVMLVSTLVNLGVSQMLFRVGRETESVALLADAWHLRTDVYTSGGVFVALLVILVGSWVAPEVDLFWIDPVAALLIALLIIRAAYRLTVHSARDLLDVSLPEEELWIRTHLEGMAPPVHGIHHLRTRRSGQVRFVEFHLLVDPEMSVQASHDITELLTRDIQGQYPGASVTIHVEPCDGTCSDTCVQGCFVDEADRARMGERAAE